MNCHMLYSSPDTICLPSTGVSKIETSTYIFFWQDRVWSDPGHWALPPSYRPSPLLFSFWCFVFVFCCCFKSKFVCVGFNHINSLNIKHLSHKDTISDLVFMTSDFCIPNSFISLYISCFLYTSLKRERFIYFCVCFFDMGYNTM